MALLPQTGNPDAPITPREVEVLGPERAARLTPAGALSLVKQDRDEAEQWLETRQWSLQWRENDILYQSPKTVVPWENGTTTRANVSRFTVAKTVNSIVPQMKSGLFYEDPPFKFRPRPSTNEATARALEALLAALLDEMQFSTEVENGLEDMVLNGTGFWKAGHCTERVIRKRFVRRMAPPKIAMPFGAETEVATAESDEFEVKEVEEVRWVPFFEHKPLGTVFVSPDWRQKNQLRKAKYIIEVSYPTFDDLDKLREYEGYDIPSTQELKEIFFAPKELPVMPSTIESAEAQNITVHHAAGREEEVSADPLLNKLQMVERWDGRRVMVMLQDKLIIRNEEHGMRRLRWYSANWWNLRNSGYGMGLGRIVGQDQRVQQGCTNAALDILSLSVNPMAVRSRGANITTQQIRSRLGGILDVDGKVDDAFKWAETPKVPGELWGMLQGSAEEVGSAAGTDEAFTMGKLPGKGASSIGRTATGAGGIISANASRIQGPVGRFVDNVFLQFIVDLFEDVCEFMPIAQMREILGDKLGEQVAQAVRIEDVLNASGKFEVLAGAHLAAKKAMAQSLPLMISILENPHLVQQLNATGWTVDVKELFEMFMEMSEWKNTRDVIRQMSPQEMQLFTRFNAAIQKVQGDMAKIKAKGQEDKELSEQQSEERMAEKLLLSSADRAAGYVERVNAEHAMEGFGGGTATRA